jgi:hypothetical protein
VVQVEMEAPQQAAEVVAEKFVLLQPVYRQVQEVMAETVE